eukprot:TRINITY_DN934_c1_g1_i1.p2 TRINITY_DN934_c1_g1~~TRINITY_DN934_c1_g1_i1.p2  ORF type:complete len:182 (-),score=63.23 TRINITY_DN934_c1_g1_i1:150-695(-)
MDFFALDLFHPPAPLQQRRGNAVNPWGLWRPMMDPSFMSSLSAWQPHSAVTRSDDGKALNVRVETPGFPRDHLNIELSDDRSLLTVSGSMRKEAGTEASANGGTDGGSSATPSAWTSIEERQFSQSYRLPRDADVEHIKADYDHGVLSVTVPTKGAVALPQKRSIAIEDKTPAAPVAKGTE